MEEEILEIVRECCEEIDPENITLDTKFIDDLDLSSMEVFSLIAEFEGAFDVKISDRDMQKMITVEDAVRVIAEKCK